MVELVVLGTTAVAVLVAKGLEARRRRRAYDALERYALRRGHAFAAGTKREGPRVVARRGDLELVVDFCRIRGELRTRVCAPATRGRAPRLAIVQRASDGTRFEQLFSVVGVAPADAPPLVVDCADPLVRLAPQSQVALASDGRRVALSWPGIEQDFELLDAALDAVAAASRWHDPTTPYRS